MVKSLRVETNSPIKDCKMALSLSKNNMKMAREWLRKNSKIISSKLSRRKSENSVVNISITPDLKSASIVHANTETDFVAKNHLFLKKFSEISKSLLGVNAKIPKNAYFDEKTLKTVLLNSSKDTVGDAANELVSTLRENIVLKGASKISLNGKSGVVSGYIHRPYSTDSGTSAAIVSIAHENVTPENRKKIQYVGSKIAMQIVAMKPKYLDVADIPKSVIEEETSILKEKMVKVFEKKSADNKGKPVKVPTEKMMEKIVSKQLEKFYEEVCLLRQSFVIDEERGESVPKAADRLLKDSGVTGKFSVEGFVLRP